MSIKKQLEMSASFEKCPTWEYKEFAFFGSPAVSLSEKREIVERASHFKRLRKRRKVSVGRKKQVKALLLLNPNFWDCVNDLLKSGFSLNEAIEIVKQ